MECGVSTRGNQSTLHAAVSKPALHKKPAMLEA
jgi:hypothetical protein